MAIDTEQKRRAASGIKPFHKSILPDGMIDVNDRRQIACLYSWGIVHKVIELTLALYNRAITASLPARASTLALYARSIAAKLFLGSTAPRVWLSGWKRRIKLTIDSEDIDAALSDFPIMVYISASSGINSDDVSCVFDELASDANRKKIAITTDDGTTQCYVEIEKWDDANEQAWLWVKVPNITLGADTELYLYYDADHADNDTYVGDTNSTPAEAVWDENFVAVYHMADGADTSHIYDSTGNNNDGTKKGANEPVETTGQIGQAQSFDGSDDYINCGDIDVVGGITLELHVYRAVDDYRYLLSKRAAYNLGQHTSGRFLWLDALTTLDYSPVGAFPTLSWNTIAGTISDTALILYSGGLPIGAGMATLDVSDYILYIGYWWGGGRWQGIIDEVRISNIARPAEWIKATNESLTDDLLNFGSEEIIPKILSITSKLFDRSKTLKIRTK